MNIILIIFFTLGLEFINLFSNTIFANQIQNDIRNENEKKTHKSLQNNDQIKIQPIDISNKIHQEKQIEKKLDEKKSAKIVLINKLSGFSNYLTLRIDEDLVLDDQNIKITLVDCKKDFDNNIKNYIAHLKVKNIRKVQNKAEEIDFEGYSQSAFLYKNSIQNSLFVINLLNCNEE